MSNEVSPFEDSINSLLYVKAKLNDKLNSLIADAKSDDTDTFDFEDAVEELKAELNSIVEEIDSVNESFN